MLAAVAFWAISIAGCAGGSQERLSTKALAAKGDVICEHLKEALNVADEKADQGGTVPARAKLSVLYAAAEEHGSSELAKLKPEGAAAEREWRQVIAKRRALIPYHHLITKYASRDELGKLEATYAAYKAAQWQMQLGFKHSRFGFKICWDIG
jgi:hypothetical protein